MVDYKPELRSPDHHGVLGEVEGSKGPIISTQSRPDNKKLRGTNRAMIPPLPAANLAMELNLVEGGRFLRFWGMLARTRKDLREMTSKTYPNYKA